MSSTGSPRSTSARTAACRRSWATATRRSRRTICASVNDEVVHGIPGDRVLVEGDVDLASTAAPSSTAGTATPRSPSPVGRRCSDDVRRLLQVTEDSLWARHRRRAPRRPAHRHLPRGREPRPRPGRLRHPRGLRRPRHRHRDAPAAERAERRPTRPRAQAGRGSGAGRRADGDPRRQGDRPRRGRVDGGHQRRQPGRPFRAHLYPDCERPLGADRARRRRGPTHRAWARRTAAVDRSALPTTHQRDRSHRPRGRSTLDLGSHDRRHDRASSSSTSGTCGGTRTSRR